MTKITHKGLWFKYSSLSKEDKNTSNFFFIIDTLRISAWTFFR